MEKHIYSREFENFLKNVTVLYVEDEDSVRDILAARLAKEFGKVHTAQNGEVGLYKFDTFRPQVIVTDITMPVMDGLDMLSAIKEKSSGVKVIVTTAHSDIDFMMRSIDIGIDRYIIKPVKIDELVSAIKKVCFQIYNEQMAIELQRKNITNENKEFITNIFEQISRSMPNPMLLYVSGKPTFMNKAFTDLFDAPMVGLIQNGDVNIEDILYIYDGNKVKVILPSGRKKILSIYKTEISATDRPDSVLYSFNDLTLHEYKNEKLKSYADILYEVLQVRHKRSELPERTKDSIDVQNTLITDILNSSEMEALRRSHVSKLSAAEYVKDLTNDVLEELDELKELEIEMSDILYMLQDDGNFALHTNEVGSKFVKYSHTIGRLIDFEDLAVAVKNFGNFLLGLGGENDVKWSRVLSYINNIKLDLNSWRTMIFVDKVAQDIHYLDSSLMSSCIQAQLDGVKQNTVLDDENDLELF